MEDIKTTLAFPLQGQLGSNQIEGKKLDTVHHDGGGERVKRWKNSNSIDSASVERGEKMVSVDYGMKSNHSVIHH